MGKRIFVFIVGGATRSEVSVALAFSKGCLSALLIDMCTICVLLQLRVCHKLTTKLNREVILGSSSIDDPPQFITVKLMFWLI